MIFHTELWPIISYSVQRKGRKRSICREEERGKDQREGRRRKKTGRGREGGVSKSYGLT